MSKKKSRYNPDWEDPTLFPNISQWIKRVQTGSQDGRTFCRLFTALVRPHLEYAQSVWSPHLARHTKMIENVQIRATKLIDGMSDIEYEERLKILKLPTLRYRRERGDMIEIYKHLNTYDKVALSPSLSV